MQKTSFKKVPEMTLIKEVFKPVSCFNSCTGALKKYSKSSNVRNIAFALTGPIPFSSDRPIW